MTQARFHRRSILSLGGAALAAPFLAGTARAAVQSVNGRAFGTGWRVSLPSGAKAGDLHTRIAEALAQVDREMSPWRANSDISRFNASAPGGMAVPEALAEVAGAALDLAARSGGAFDPTVGPSVARWGFGPIHGADADWRVMAAEPGVLSKSAPATLDLCGIAKGWALDRMAGLLEAAGQGDYLIDLGGELRARGRHPDGRRWRVGIEHPAPGVTALAGSLALTEGAVATSGRKAQSYDLGTRRYSHIIDPSTGDPVQGRLEQVTVLAPTAMQADGWATALMAAGSDAPALAGREGIGALLLFAKSEGLSRVAVGRLVDASKGDLQWNF